MLIDWLLLIVVKYGAWLHALVHVVGLAVCVRAFQRCRKPGWIVLAAFFLLAAGGLLLGPFLTDALAGRSHTQPQLLREEEQRYQQELAALHQKYYPSATNTAAASPRQVFILLPLGPLILVVGVWLMARNDCKHSRATIASDIPKSQ